MWLQSKVNSHNTIHGRTIRRLRNLLLTAFDLVKSRQLTMSLLTHTRLDVSTRTDLLLDTFASTMVLGCVIFRSRALLC
jgi:hypothetical protein